MHTSWSPVEDILLGLSACGRCFVVTTMVDVMLPPWVNKKLPIMDIGYFTFNDCKIVYCKKKKTINKKFKKKPNQ